MSAILFVTWDGGGNVPPATADRPRAAPVAGTTSASSATARQERPLTRGRASTFVRPTARRGPSRRTTTTRRSRMLATFADSGMGRDLLDAVAAEPADLVVVDCLLFGAMARGAAVGAAVRRARAPVRRGYRTGILGGPMGLSLRLRRLRSAAVAGRWPTLRLVMTLPELDPVDGHERATRSGRSRPWTPRVRPAEPDDRWSA